MTLPIELDPEEKGNSMSKPSAIPEDVMRAAQAVVNASHQPGAEKALLVARAIMAERERCLSVCRGWLAAFGERGSELEFTSPQEWANGAVEDIAEVIASGATASTP